MNERGQVIAPGHDPLRAACSPGRSSASGPTWSSPTSAPAGSAAAPIEPRVGGRFDLDFDHRRISDRPEPTPEEYEAMAEGIQFEGRVTAWDPPRRFGYAWIEDDFGESEVTFDLAAEGDRRPPHGHPPRASATTSA